MNYRTALGIIDVQRGFMPHAEGERLEVVGFGELPVAGSEAIIPRIHALIGAYALDGAELFTTQDWHPLHTAHFSEHPDFKTTWPVHCVADSSGAKLHPELVLPESTEHFYKGQEALKRGEDDTSYSGYNATNEHGLLLPDWLEHHLIDRVDLVGLALDYCVGATALDLAQRTGLEVSVISDATAPVAAETGEAMVERLEAAGIHVMTSRELLTQLEAA